MRSVDVVRDREEMRARPWRSISPEGGRTRGDEVYWLVEQVQIVSEYMQCQERSSRVNLVLKIFDQELLFK